MDKIIVTEKVEEKSELNIPIFIAFTLSYLNLVIIYLLGISQDRFIVNDQVLNTASAVIFEIKSGDSIEEQLTVALEPSNVEDASTVKVRIINNSDENVTYKIEVSNETNNIKSLLLSFDNTNYYNINNNKLEYYVDMLGKDEEQTVNLKVYMPISNSQYIGLVDKVVINIEAVQVN